MLPKSRRIQRRMMENILMKGGLKHSNLFTARILIKADEESKFSFVVSKKVAKTAVLRNKLRRQGYSSIEEVKNIQKGYWVAFFYKKEAATASYSTIKGVINDFLRQNKLLV